jgi:BioD-like phosphotransacetylase family protein
MKRIVIGSTRENAGKTSIIAGIATALKGDYGYIKPLGDRLIYKKKKSWDYDSCLIVDILGLDVESENTSIGFDHCKLRYKYDQSMVKDTVNRMAAEMEKGKEALFIEGGKDLSYGSSLQMDTIALTDYLNAELILVISGNDDTIIDDISYLKNYTDTGKIKIKGVIINKVHDPEDFKNSYGKVISDAGITILGIVPFHNELTDFTISYLAEKIFATYIAGETGSGRIVKNIFVGAMSQGEMLRNILFSKDNKLIITSGDRSDVILTALESSTSGIVLTNNILPPPNIVSMAAERQIPLLLVKGDTFKVAKQIDDMEPLLSIDNSDNIKLLTELAGKHIDTNRILK